MFKPINIYRMGNFYQAIDSELPNLKGQVKLACGKHVRRIDRFTQLALIGACQSVKDMTLQKNTGIYLSSIYGSLNNSLDVLKDMFKQNSLPSPLKFVSTVSNAACFHLADQFGLQANSQFIARDDFGLEGCLKFAELDIQTGRVEAALVGVVCEVGLPLDVHRQRLSIAPREQLGEASHWLLLAKNLPGELPLATIVLVEEPLPFDSMFEKVAQYLQSENSVDVVFGAKVSAIDIENIEREYSVTARDFSFAKPSYEFSAALSVCEWLEVESSAKMFVHIDVEAGGRWSLMVLEKTC